MQGLIGSGNPGQRTARIHAKTVNTHESPSIVGTLLDRVHWRQVKVLSRLISRENLA